MSRRDFARPIIARVIAENAGKTPSELREALKAAYPWGPRQYHPYKIWLDEIARQLGRKPKLGTLGPRTRARLHDPRQEALFA